MVLSLPVLYAVMSADAYIETQQNNYSEVKIFRSKSHQAEKRLFT